MPPPVPVASTTGVGNSVFAPKFSATAVVNGNTVEDPTMRRPWRWAPAPGRISVTAPADAADASARSGAAISSAGAPQAARARHAVEIKAALSRIGIVELSQASLLLTSFISRRIATAIV